MGEQLHSRKRGISVVMSAYNEEFAIRGALESIVAWADEIVVVNCESSDQTEAIARGFTDRVITASNKLMLNVNKNIAIDAARRDWVLVLDPDERVTPELAEELRAVASAESRASGYWMPRRNHELGRWIRHMGAYPDLQLRFFSNGAARFPCRHIHEMVDVHGEIGYLKGALDHWPRQILFDYVHKRNLYSEHRSTYLYENGIPFRVRNLLIRPINAFVKQYVVRGGWREGIPGLVISVSGAYGTFLQDAKLWQKWQQSEKVSDAAGFSGDVSTQSPLITEDSDL